MTGSVPSASGNLQGVEDTVPASAIRVGVLCDFREEQWLSMDLVGDMLCKHLTEDCADQVISTQLVPALRRRFERVPWLGRKLGRNADRLMNRFRDYPAWLAARRDGFDLFHLVDHSYSQLIPGLRPKAAVVTCHDLDTFRCVLDPEREKRPAWFRAMTRRILDGFRQADHVIAVSNATRDEILLRNLFAPDQITVVPNGVHPACSPLPDARPDASAANWMPDLGTDTFWLLSVGNTLPRKRLDVLLRVFAGVLKKAPQARLVRVGGLTPALERLAAELKIEHAMLNLPFLDRDQLAAVYRRATLLLHTAEAEGFGLPLIEAMACGCPVAASQVPVLQEVGGSAAVYSPVANIEEWVEKVGALLDEKMHQADAWELRRRNGRVHAGRFSWRENARRTALIYEKILEGK